MKQLSSISLLLLILLSLSSCGKYAKKVGTEIIEKEGKHVLKHESRSVARKLGSEMAKKNSKAVLKKSMKPSVKLMAKRAAMRYSHQLVSPQQYLLSYSKEVVGQPKSGTILLKNMLLSNSSLEKYYKQGGHAAHHIVGASKGAEKALAVLKKFNIDINSSANGVLLPTDIMSRYKGTIHNGMHSQSYIQFVNEAITKAKSRKEVLEILDKIKKQLIDGSLELYDVTKGHNAVLSNV